MTYNSSLTTNIDYSHMFFPLGNYFKRNPTHVGSAVETQQSKESVIAKTDTGSTGGFHYNSLFINNSTELAAIIVRLNFVSPDYFYVIITTGSLTNMEL